MRTYVGAAVEFVFAVCLLSLVLKFSSNILDEDTAQHSTAELRETELLHI